MWESFQKTFGILLIAASVAHADLDEIQDEDASAGRRQQANMTWHAACQNVSGKALYNNAEISGNYFPDDFNHGAITDRQCKKDGKYCHPKGDSLECGKDSPANGSDSMEDWMMKCFMQGGAQGAAASVLQNQQDPEVQAQNACNQSFEQARVACDWESSVGIKGALEKMEHESNLVKEADEKGMKAACEKYQKVFNEVSSELKSFRNACAPAKAQCLTTCNVTLEEADQVGQVMNNVLSCVPYVNMIAPLLTNTKNTVQKNLANCTSFENILDQTDAEYEKLVKAARDGDLCNQAMIDDCKADPTNEKCRQELNASSVREDDVSQLGDSLAQLGDLNSSPTSPFNATSPGIDPVEQQEPNRVNANNAPGAAANLGSSGGAGGGPSGARGSSGGGYYSQYGDLYERMKGDNLGRSKKGGYPRGGGGYKGRSGRSGRSGRRPSSRRSAKGKVDLKNFLPGGKNDPRAGLVDGITPASGPTIFQKVNSRYQLYKTRLLP